MSTTKALIISHNTERTLVKFEQQRVLLLIATHKMNVAFMGFLNACGEVFKDVEKQ